MLTALTLTPSTFTRWTSIASLLRHSIADLRLKPLGDLRFDPCVGARDSFLERNLRLPAEDFTQPIVVGIAAADALRPGDVLLGDFDARGSGHEIGELVDADQPVLTEIDWLLVTGFHEEPQALDAVVDVTERPRLPAIAPDFDRVVAGQLRARDLAAHRRWRLLASAIPRAKRR